MNTTVSITHSGTIEISGSIVSKVDLSETDKQNKPVRKHYLYFEITSFRNKNFELLLKEKGYEFIKSEEFAGRVSYVTTTEVKHPSDLPMIAAQHYAQLF